VRENPSFVSKIKKVDKVDRSHTDKTELIKLQVFKTETSQPQFPKNTSSLLSSRIDAQMSVLIYYFINVVI
jgi:hypothetical protein